MTLFLVRHGRPIVDPSRPASEWELDPSGFDDVWALRDRLPAGATWYSSPEPKALQTVELLTDGEVGVVDGLREHRRERAGWIDDFESVVRRAFAAPAESAHPGWEPLEACRARVVAAVKPVLITHHGEDVVLVGHGTAWTLLVAHLRGAPPDIDAWARLGLPDVIET